VISLRFGGGALGQVLAATSMFPGTFKRLQVGGRGGTAEVLEDQLTVWSFRDALPEDDATRAQFGAATGHGGGASDPMAIDYGLHTANLAAFLAALDAGERQAISGHEARKAVAIIEAAYESARSGRPARVR
jgi:predicted dehydrogenase